MSKSLEPFSSGSLQNDKQTYVARSKNSKIICSVVANRRRLKATGASRRRRRGRRGRAVQAQFYCLNPVLFRYDYTLKFKQIIKLQIKCWAHCILKQFRCIRAYFRSWLVLSPSRLRPTINAIPQDRALRASSKVLFSAIAIDTKKKRANDINVAATDISRLNSIM